MSSTLERNFQEINEEFLGKMWELSPTDIWGLKTIVLWEFGSIPDPERSYFFIKNLLFTSNYREKIHGRLRFGGRIRYVQETDTGEPVECDNRGNFTPESGRKILEKRKELDPQYLIG